MPFGIAIPKADLFSIGGRPVIYQSDIEFLDLPEELRWRHVRYEPNADPPIDFTWEREWRFFGRRLQIPPDLCTVIVPNEEWRDRLIELYDESERMEAWRIDEAFGHRYYIEEPFPFDVQVMPEASAWE